MNKKKSNVGFVVAISILCATLVLFVTLFTISATKSTGLTSSLENIYQKNFYDLVDNINNTENKLSKTINATNSEMQAKYLKEVSNNARLAEINFNNLPYASNGMQDSISFINQLSGYAETLAKNLEEGNSLSSKDTTTLENVYDSVLYMKNQLAKMNQDMWEGYSIIDASKSFNGEENKFTNSLMQIKEIDVDYPTMIYDGPFSESVINKEIKGLSGNEVSKEDAQNKILDIFTNVKAEQIEFIGDSQGKFETYNFSVKNQDEKEYLFIQITKQGGHLLTATSYADKKAENISIDNAKEIALNFAKRNKIENAEVVWYATVNGNAYVNLAPKQNGIVLYPDLVKVKIDLGNGDILGYEATNYFTNHIQRNLGTPSVTKESVQKNIPSKFLIKFSRLALIPLDFNQEVLTYEFACKMGSDEYYFYFDAFTGAEVNILKVLKTNNGEMLM